MTGLGANLNFIRDRTSEHFLWTIGLMYEPEYGYFRRVTAQVVALITTIDDIYDEYGTLDQLQLFTDAVERWGRLYILIYTTTTYDIFIQIFESFPFLVFS